MTKINIAADCDNAPKKRYIKDFIVALAKADIDTAAGMLSDDTTWTIVGDDAWAGAENIKQNLKDMPEATELSVDNILSHGKLCSANGVLTYENKKVAFCNMYEFSSHSQTAKIKTVTSYQVVLSKN